jgi:hypothetical protein
MASQRSAVDWKKARLDYESGILNPNEISKKYGCSPAAVYKRKKNEGWKRSLAKAAMAKTELLLAEELTEGEYDKDEALDAQTILDGAAKIQFEKIKTHRARLTRLDTIIERHMKVLESGSYVMLKPNGEEVVALVDVQESTRLLTSVSRALQVQITLERQSYGMDAGENDDRQHTSVYMDLGLADHAPTDDELNDQDATEPDE